MAFTDLTLTNLIEDVLEELEDYGTEDILNGAINSSVTTLTSTDSEYKQYKKNTLLEINEELMLVTAAPSSTSITVRRGVRGTTAASHADLDTIRFGPKYKKKKIKRHINMCLTSELQQQKTTDASTTSATNTYLYDLPTGITKDNLRAVFLRSSTTDASAETEGQITWYRINEAQGTAGVDQIEFRYLPTPSRYIKFVYRPNYTFLTDMTDSCDLPSNPAAQSLPMFYACAHLLLARETKRLRRDRNTQPDGATPSTARERHSDWYMDEFKRIRRQQGLEPNRTTTRTVGW